MSAVQNVQTHLLKTNTYILFFIEMLTKENDVFLQEYSSRILAELSSDFTGSAMFLEKYHDLSFLFDKLKSEDPDVKKNCVEIIFNLLRDFDGHKAITTSKVCKKNSTFLSRECIINLEYSFQDFSFKLIYDLFLQPYPIIQQLALDVIELLAMHNKDENLQELFRQSGGVKYLIDIMDVRV